MHSTTGDESLRKLAVLANQVKRANSRVEFRRAVYELKCFGNSDEARTPGKEAHVHLLLGQLYLKIALHTGEAWDEPAFHMLNKAGFELAEALDLLRQLPNISGRAHFVQEAVEQFVLAQETLRRWGHEHNLEIKASWLSGPQRQRIVRAQTMKPRK